MYAKAYGKQRSSQPRRKFTAAEYEAARLKREQEIEQERKRQAEIREGVQRRHFYMTTTLTEEGIDEAMKQVEAKRELRAKGAWWAL